MAEKKRFPRFSLPQKIISEVDVTLEIQILDRDQLFVLKLVMRKTPPPAA